MEFSLLAQDRDTAARRGQLSCAHGVVQTPVFMPVGTQATVKTLSPRDLEELGAEIILGNTYHLNIRPGMEVIRELGGLHRFMAWPHPILTDSGGYQIFSLSKLRKVRPEGVTFQSHVDGARLFLGPKEAMAIQRDLGSDIAMVLDECTPFPATHEQARKSLRLTLEWARQCREQPRTPGQMVFGIVQGGLHRDLRVQSAVELRGMDFDGLALGGLSVGEPEADMYTVLDWTVPELPADKPRYLMGVGTPAQVVRAVARGIDMFDCVLPTRVGRNGSAYTATGAVPIKAGRFKADSGPIEEGCACYACRTFSRAYIRHLLNVDEILGLRLMTVHNLTFYLTLMARIRDHIENGTFRAFHDEFLARYEGE
ncbi:MAG: tRNA guanosine(34) transglycosylase Tgt [Lentisphaerae bacterium RIFOXYB12_FULL_65_16]|nr:MAG: tRNA guanosine(34) transglycosylase Tgt [Lentisphaerae bacterium RIFOXYA12_64_32]OGV90784.1 MAG: tRNA guanosine(34) transglycosylase Tgt [Lentisphaerae bacterium RIFOXYB12_FULL_65_16]